MLKYILKRIGYMVFVFLILSFLIFSLFSLIPSDPARAQLEPVRKTLKPEQYIEQYNLLRKQMGLDDPDLVRYGRWLKGLIFEGDLGYSTSYLKDVRLIIVEPMKNTVLINVISVFLALGITIPLGISCAVRQKSRFDNAVQVGTILGYSTPIFIISLVFIYIFAVLLGIFPVSGMNTPGRYTGGVRDFSWLIDRIYYLSLPLLVMTFASLGGMTRYVRAAMIDALNMDYIKTARAKGLREKAVVYSHAWRNALLPVITLIIGWFLSIFTGSIIIEQTFGLNGMGKLYIEAINSKDSELILAMQMFYVAISLVGNLLIDLSYGIVDPRIRVNK